MIAFGDISIDVPVTVDHLLRADEKQWGTTVGEFPGGMGANVAAAFATLGGKAGLVASVGSDERGRMCLADLEERAVDLTSVVRVDGATFWTLALLDSTGEKAMLMFETPALRVPWERTDYEALRAANVAHFIAESGPEMLEVMEFCRAHDVVTSVDVEETALHLSDLPEIVARADIVFCGGRSVLDSLGSGSDLTAKSRDITKRGPRTVATTLGRDGCFVGSRDGTAVRVPGIAVEAVDTTGAGDCFAGAFLFGVTSGWTNQASAEVANAMAGVSVTAYGSRGCLLDVAQLALRPEARGSWFAMGRSPH